MHTPLADMALAGMPGLGEWVLIGLAVLLFFGASRLPKMGQGLGEGIRNFKKALEGKDEQPLPPKKDDKAEGDKGEEGKE
ncbi:MAG: twin-arginine translocase TatA/TatE family subunit [Deltaproteobacteria bacterium]|nr:twin-arginine translocase TatA/TatE family subunit [Deltaproteobacteria bacterium]